MLSTFGVQPLAEIAEPIEIGVRHTPVCVRFVLCSLPTVPLLRCANTCCCRSRHIVLSSERS